MKLIVASSHGIGAWLIKLFTFSRWNHAAVLFDDSENLNGCSVVDAIAGDGVRLMSYAIFTSRYPDHLLLDVEVPDEKTSKRYIISQVGKPYDWGAILGIVFQNRNWESPNRWFCAEIAAAACSKAGKPMFRPDVKSIFPKDIYSVI